MDQTDSGGSIGGPVGGGSGGIGQNKKGIFRNSQTYVVLGIIVIALIIYFSTKGDKNQNNDQNSQNQSETDQNNQNNTPDQSNNPDNGNQNSQNNQNGQNNPVQGNVSASGTLRNSDTPARGNLIVDSPSGKIYISTSRDFSSQLDKQVTLQAQGTLKQFTFLGFAESNVDTTAKGGAGEETPSGNVSFSGTLQNSDNTSRGNYVITSGNTKVYLQSSRDHSSLVGSEVNLSATGTINSFTNALVTKK
jgi:hypothetical protein